MKAQPFFACFVMFHVSAIVAIACSSSSDDGTTSPPIDGGAIESGNIDSGDATANDGDSGAAYLGIVSITQQKIGEGYASSLTADFIKNNGAALETPPGCVTSTSGACRFVDCSKQNEAGATAPIIYASAGDLTISGGKLGSPLKLAFTMNGGINHYDSLLSAQTFVATDTFSVTATGQDIAAFNGTSAAAPADVAVISPLPINPDASTGYLFAIDETVDLVVQWTGGSAGSSVELAIGNENGKSVLTCDFDAQSGTGTIPAALLARLGPAVGDTTSSLSIITKASAPITIANATADFELSSFQAFGSFKTP